MAFYHLLKAMGYAAATDGAAFPTGGRLRWSLQLVQSSGGPAEVVVEASQTADDDEWRQVGTFGSLAGYQNAKRSSYEPNDAPTLSLREGDLYLRARILADPAAEAFLAVVARGKFLALGVPEDEQLIQKDTREWSQEIARLVEQAESDVVGHLRPGLEGAFARANVEHPEFYERVRRAIARQTEFLAQRERLRRTNNPTAQVTWREMSRVALSPDAEAILAPVTEDEHAASLVWLGR